MRPRIVLDANIYVSALMSETGPPGLLLKFIVSEEKYQLVMSHDILDELQRVLFYPKVRSRIKRRDEEISAWLDAINILSFFVEPRATYEILLKEDPDDDRYLIAALESRAKFIISGDKHLLGLKFFEDIRILTAKEFLDLA